MTTVHSLASDQLEGFMNRRRYSAFFPSRLKIDSFLREILSKANDFVPSSSGSVLLDLPAEKLAEGGVSVLHFVAAFGPDAEEILGKTLPSGRGIAGHVYRSGNTYVMQDPAADPYFDRSFSGTYGFDTKSLIAVPVRIEQSVCGVLELINRSDGNQYDGTDRELLEIFARYTSVSIENLLDAQRANEMARLDDLTGLYNDRFFHHRLTEDLVRADVKDSTVGLLFLDLDNFKQVNDTHGHLAGSQVLKEFGFMLKQAVHRENCTLARYGGDEFVVILPDHDVAEALEVGMAIRKELAHTEFLQGSFSWTDMPVTWAEPLTCSVGVGVYPAHVARRGTTDLKKNLLLRAADQAMYAAKADGKNSVRIAEADDS